MWRDEQEAGSFAALRNDNQEIKSNDKRQKQKQIPFGNDRKKSNSNSNGRSRSFAALRMTILKMVTIQ